VSSHSFSYLALRMLIIHGGTKSASFVLMLLLATEISRASRPPSELPRRSLVQTVEIAKGHLVRGPETSAESENQTTSEGSLLGYRWRKGKQLGKGAFGSIWEASAADGEIEHPVSIKLELTAVKKRELDKEASILLDLQGPGIPKFYEYTDNAGMPGGQRYLVMEKLGINLEQYRDRCGGKLSEAIVLRLAHQMITRFEQVHENPKHFLYRDTKPNNFMIGWDPVTDKLTDTVFLIDFGLCSTYWDSLWKMHLPQLGPGGRLAGFAGTQRYASMNAFRRYQQGRRDDMESLGYVWSHLFTGALPWAGMKPSNMVPASKAKLMMFVRQLRARKTAIDADWRYEKKAADGGGTENMLPDVLKKYMKEVMALAHDQRPDYQKYLRMIEAAAEQAEIDLQGGFVQADGTLKCE